MGRLRRRIVQPPGLPRSPRRTRCISPQSRPNRIRARRAERDWEDFWAATRPIELTATVEQHAGHLARAHALRGADAVHLASALAVGDPGLIVAVWDRRLHTGAQAAGCRVAPAQLDP